MDADGGFGFGDCPDDVVTFDVGILFNLVGDLKREQGKTHAAVVRSGGKPIHCVAAGEHPPVGAAPKADVMPFGGIIVHLLLVGEVLPFGSAFTYAPQVFRAKTIEAALELLRLTDGRYGLDAAKKIGVNL